MTFQDRRERIITLLDHWQDFNEQATSGTPTSAEPTTVLAKDWTLLSSMSRHPSVLELRRCLEQLRLMGPTHYAHLRAYFDADTRLVDRPCKRRDHRNRVVDDVERVRERVLPFTLRGVPACVERIEKQPCCTRPRTVCRALDALVGLFHGDPELPLALTRKLRPLADSDGWTEAAA